MTWRDQLRPASFRGVAFYVRDHEVLGGRRGVLHEYPARDLPFAEDLGRRARSHRIEGYVLGEDYFAARDRLIEALEAPGPGTLVHPYLGTLKVAVIGAGYALSERAREGRIARFSMVFVQAGENRFPAATLDTKAEVAARAETAALASEAAFEEAFDIGDKIAFIAEAASETVVEAADAIGALADALIAPLDALPDFQRDLLTLRGNVASLITTPAVLANRIRVQVEAILGFGDDLRETFGLLGDLGLFGQGKSPPPAGTANRSVQARNGQAVTDLTRRAAAVASARAASGLEFDSRQAALGVRDDLAARLDAAMLAAGDAGDDAVYGALADLRAAAIRDLNARGARLPDLRSVQVPAPLPALALAHRLDGADPAQVPAQAAALVARNRVRHPGFVPGGTAIEVPLNA